MSTDRLGIVTGIRRQDGEVDAQVLGAKISAPYNASRMPWPLCQAWFRQIAPGSWYCVGPVGERRLVFYDDFIEATSSTPYGDTAWSTYLSSGCTVARSTGIASGTLRISMDTSGDTGYVYKDSDGMVVPISPGGLWLSARVRPNGVWATLGFAKDPAAGSFDYMVDSQAGSVAYGSGFTIAASQSITDGTLGFLDFVACDGLGTGWVDGSGPVYATSAAEAAGTAISPAVGFTTLGAGTPVSLSVDVDCVSLYRVVPVIHPVTL